MEKRQTHIQPGVRRPVFQSESVFALLAEQRWPEGFVCPSCGTSKGWPSKRNRATRECAGCARQTSVTAGTVMHSSHLPLRTWFLAAHIISSHSNGMSALQLQAQPGLGSYKTAWLLLQKLRRSMSTLIATPWKTLVEIDETEMPFRSRHDPEDRPKGGRSPVGKMFVDCAVELSSDGHPRRARMKHIPQWQKASSTASENAICNAISTNSCSAGSDGDTCEAPSTRCWRSVLVSGQRHIAILLNSAPEHPRSRQKPRPVNPRDVPN